MLGAMRGAADEGGRERFARALADARAAAGKSQTALAEELGLSQSNVSAWEAARWAPEPPQCFALEEALGLPGGFLSQHLGYVPAAGSAPAPLDVEKAIMADALLDLADKRALLSLYRELARRHKRSRPRRS